MEKSVNSHYYRPENWDWWELPGWAHNADWPNMRLIGNWMPLVNDSQDRASIALADPFAPERRGEAPRPCSHLAEGEAGLPVHHRRSPSSTASTPTVSCP